MFAVFAFNLHSCYSQSLLYSHSTYIRVIVKVCYITFNLHSGYSQSLLYSHSSYIRVIVKVCCIQIHLTFSSKLSVTLVQNRTQCEGDYAILDCFLIGFLSSIQILILIFSCHGKLHFLLLNKSRNLSSVSHHGTKEVLFFIKSRNLCLDPDWPSR